MRFINRSRFMGLCRARSSSVLTSYIRLFLPTRPNSIPFPLFFPFSTLPAGVEYTVPSPFVCTQEGFRYLFWTNTSRRSVDYLVPFASPFFPSPLPDRICLIVPSYVTLAFKGFPFTQQTRSYTRFDLLLDPDLVCRVQQPRLRISVCRLRGPPHCFLRSRPRQ